MQIFIDTTNQQVWAFELDVVATVTAGVYSFVAAHGAVLNTPTTLQPYVTPAPTAAQLLVATQAAQLTLLKSAWQTATLIPVSYPSLGGAVKTYQTDAQSISNLTGANIACAQSGITPAGFFWVAADNTQVPFAYADLQGLAAAIFAQSAADFARYQIRKAAILAALTVAAVEVITF